MIDRQDVSGRVDLLIKYALAVATGAVAGGVYGVIWWTLLLMPWGAAPLGGTLLLLGFAGGALVGLVQANGWYYKYWYLQELKRKHRRMYLDYIKAGALRAEEDETQQDFLWAVTGCATMTVVPTGAILVANLILVPFQGWPLLLFGGLFIWSWIHSVLESTLFHLGRMEEEIQARYSVPDWFRRQYDE